MNPHVRHFDHPIPTEPQSRRDFMRALFAGASAVIIPSAMLMMPRRALARPQVQVLENYTESSASALVRSALESVSRGQLPTGFADMAMTKATGIGVSTRVRDDFIELAGRAVEGVGSVVKTTFPFVYAAVQVGAAVVRGVAKWLSTKMTRDGGAFAVTDRVYRVASFLSNRLGGEQADPWVIPTHSAEPTTTRVEGQDWAGTRFRTQEGNVFISDDDAYLSDSDTAPHGPVVVVSESRHGSDPQQPFLLSGFPS